MKNNLIKKFLIVLILAVFVNIAPFNVSYAEEEDNLNNRYNVVVVVDASNSMNYTDPEGLRFEAINQFVGLLAEKGNMLGGVVFRDDVTQTPIINADSDADKNRIIEQLRSVKATGYTNIGGALECALNMIDENSNPELPSAILLLSDGNTEMPTDEELKESIKKKEDAVRKAWDKDIPIYSVCLNANKKADVSEMEQISTATSGIFKEVTKAEDLKDVFNAFYSLIYETATIPLFDGLFDTNGKIEVRFNVPGFGVEEVNIVVNGSAKNVNVIDPNDNNSNSKIKTSNTFTIVKISDIIPGQWKLIAEGVPNDNVKINMVYNTNLEVEISAEPNIKYINPVDPLTIKAKLKAGNKVATENTQYTGYDATLQITDAYGDLVDSINMELSDGEFIKEYKFNEGTYFYNVVVTGYYLNKTSDSGGPITVTKDEPTEEEKNNTPPVPVEEKLEKKVYIWPFKGGSLSVDMKTLAVDKQDSTLRYKIEKTIFEEGEDYSIDDDILTIDHFSTSNGAFLIRATDSGGLYCDIELVVKSYNIGLMTAIGLGIAALIAAVIVGILLYIAFTKPFYGNITIFSYVDGQYKDDTIKPKRGRCRLSAFKIKNIGLNYYKSYFKAAKGEYVVLVTDKSVYCDGVYTKEKKIYDDIEVEVFKDSDSVDRLTIRFTSFNKK